MICDDLSHMRVYRIGSRQSSIMGSPQVIRYSSIPILSYSISFTCSYSSPTQAAITKDLSLTVAEDLSTLCLVLYPTWLLWLVQFPQSLMNAGRLSYHLQNEGRFRLHSIRDVSVFTPSGTKKLSISFARFELSNSNKRASLSRQTIKLCLEENKIVAFIKLDFGNVVMVTRGRNRGSGGVIRNRAKLKGSFETTTTYKTQQDMSLQQG
ncbi:hypothetical protein HID58_005465 [Brassica napus]|uniref:Uncharacterized protein n=1 Tax=Brassica napus TaxID=3708 RepID=A0ABQ8E8P5_BRANA|nr:hypothetical protein HID58_005465 [Brassica napus]